MEHWWSGCFRMRQLMHRLATLLALLCCCVGSVLLTLCLAWVATTQHVFSVTNKVPQRSQPRQHRLDVAAQPPQSSNTDCTDAAQPQSSMWATRMLGASGTGASCITTHWEYSWLLGADGDQSAVATILGSPPGLSCTKAVAWMFATLQAPRGKG